MNTMITKLLKETLEIRLEKAETLALQASYNHDMDLLCDAVLELKSAIQILFAHQVEQSAASVVQGEK